MSEPQVLFEVKDAVALATLNRPGRRRADAREGVEAFLEKRDPRWSLRPSTDLPELDPLG